MMHSEKKLSLYTQELQQEAIQLRQSLSEFSHWIQQKMQTIEEEMDVCKVIYSLHGSLSQVGGHSGSLT